jgi:ribose 5-phosphate isomerase B
LKIALAADHGGFPLKEEVKQHLIKSGMIVEDFGCFSTESVDYPDYAIPAARAITSGQADLGIFICGTGIGMSIAANKQPGIRAALVHDVFTAKATREHNDSNVLCMGGRVIGPSLALTIVDTWLQAEFSGGRHIRRIEKLEAPISLQEHIEYTVSELTQQADDVLTETAMKGKVAPGSLLIVGCSTSEIRGKRIGSDSNAHTAAAVYEGLTRAAKRLNLQLAFQCCEHLNRSVVINRSVMEHYRLQQVSVVPVAHAGGAMATHAFRAMPEAVVVSSVDHQAQAGIDIGNTLIGMHLRTVAVPLRLTHKTIGAANVQAAFSRPPLVGGKRAVYSLEQEREANRE